MDCLGTRIPKLPRILNPSKERFGNRCPGAGKQGLRQRSLGERPACAQIELRPRWRNCRVVRREEDRLPEMVSESEIELARRDRTRTE